MMSETTTVSEKNVPAQQPADSGENVSDGFQPGSGGDRDHCVHLRRRKLHSTGNDGRHPSGRRTGEYFLEISGPVEKDETISDEAENMLENTHPDEFGDASVSLTIYAGEKVYGFYGKAKVAEEAEDSVQHIEIMGHKEGFYDGEELYSQE